MGIAEVQAALLDGPRFAVKDLAQELEELPGIYAMFVDDAGSLPDLYCKELRSRGTELIYVGMTKENTIVKRCREVLLGQRTATFFRSVGAMRGRRPEQSSLVGKVNKKNFVFSKSDKRNIVSWLDAHVEVSCVHPTANQIREIRNEVIEELVPLLNIKGISENKRFSPLVGALDECLEIALRPDA